MTQHLLVFLTLIALIWLISHIHGQSEGEEEKKPVAGKPRATRTEERKEP